jgi:bifunctional UDP-N-acetylglucosamine pyrophosphorylase/glucosamine-1-phosphate N-acetyltransferase
MYVFPGDMGLITERTVRSLRDRFTGGGCDMVVLTGRYEGDPGENSYGRILKSRNRDGRIIEIKEHRDILAMDPRTPYRVRFQGRDERFTRQELLEIREFNVGVYALRAGTLRSHLGGLQPDNVQAELYVTDLIKILNDHGLQVCSSPVHDNSAVSFNVKSTLKKMEAAFRNRIYERLKDIITVDDPEDFYIAEETVARIEAMDREHDAVEITVGKGAHIGPRVEVNRGLTVGRHARLEGHVRLGAGVSIGESVHLSTYPEQTIEIGDGCTVFRGNVIKGMVRIGSGVRIETGVRITGSSQEPVIIGDGVLIKGTTYLFGSVVEDGVLIEHSVLKSCTVERVVRKDGTVQPVKYILPHPEGLDSVAPRRPRLP